MKRIKYNEQFAAIVDLFNIDYKKGEKALIIFAHYLATEKLTFTTTNIKGGTRFKILTNLNQWAIIERMLSDLDIK